MWDRLNTAKDALNLNSLINHRNIGTMRNDTEQSQSNLLLKSFNRKQVF